MSIFIKTNKTILDFFNKISLKTTKMRGTIYLDTEKNVYYQNLNLNFKIPKFNNPNSRFYIIKEEDKHRPDRLGYIAYGDESLTWVILKHNNIIDPFNLEVGKIIEFPPYDVILKALNELKNNL